MNKKIKSILIGGVGGAIWGVISLIVSFVILPYFANSLHYALRIVLLLTIALPSTISYILGLLVLDCVSSTSHHCGDAAAFKFVLPLTIPFGIAMGIIMHTIIKSRNDWNK
jgi:hypothetical protein